MWDRIRQHSFFIWFLIQVICLLLLLAGCFRKNELVADYSGKEIEGLEMQPDGLYRFQGDSMSLAPGIYEVKVKLNFAEGRKASVRVVSAEPYYRELLGNAVDVYAGQEMSFLVWAMYRIGRLCAM